MTEESEDPKLIIDEDWKTQVQREMEELKQKQQDDSQQSKSAAAEVQTGSDNSEEGEGDVPPPPPASLSFLITSLATQSMASMGQIPGEDGKPMPVNLEYARHFIDLIAVLDEKTKGNLSEEEDKFLQETLHQMRMMFVAMIQQQGS